MILLSLLSCFGNDEPKFETYNGQKIKYLLGFAYVGSLADQEFVVRAGETLEMDFGIRDPNGDDFEMWFPYAPEGLDFPRNETKGAWTVPTSYHQEFVTFQVLAVDEHGAAGSIFLNYFLEGVQITQGTRGLLSGWIDTVSGDVRLRLQYEGCEFLGGSWDEPSAVPLTLTSLEPCENCDLAYEIRDLILEKHLKTQMTQTTSKILQLHQKKKMSRRMNKKNPMIGGKQRTWFAEIF